MATLCVTGNIKDCSNFNTNSDYNLAALKAAQPYPLITTSNGGKMSSMNTNSNYVCLYTEDNFTGTRSIPLKGTYNTFSDTFNDRVKSVKISTLKKECFQNDSDSSKSSYNTNFYFFVVLLIIAYFFFIKK